MYLIGEATEAPEYGVTQVMPVKTNKYCTLSASLKPTTNYTKITAECQLLSIHTYDVS